MSGAQPSSASAAPAATSRNATKRLLKELDAWRDEQKEESGIERLGPAGEEDLFVWEAVVNGKGVGGGYDGEISSLLPSYRLFDKLTGICLFSAGRWLVSISIPPSYPLQPPKMRFVTSIVHPNIALDTGEICLDLLKDAWTPTYSILQCVRAVRMLLGYPEVDSPLNVDAAVLLRDKDQLGMRRLVEFWCSDERGKYEGH